MAEKYASTVEKYGVARDRFWVWLYLTAGKRLPDGYMDGVWMAYLEQRLDELRNRTSDNFAVWFINDLESLEIDGQGRDFRLIDREYRYER